LLEHCLPNPLQVQSPFKDFQRMRFERYLI
jgi:hypothetical protein